MKKFAFTLAEVMITLAIIGVIASLTIPPLMNNYRKHIYVAQLRKTYNAMEDAIKRYMADERVDNFSEASIDYYDFANEYFVVITSCYRNLSWDRDKCFYDSPYRDALTSAESNGVVCVEGLNCFNFATKYGAAISLKQKEGGSKKLKFDVDVNGYSGPNIDGRDLIRGFYIDNDGTIKAEDGSYAKRIMDDNWKMKY